MAFSDIGNGFGRKPYFPIQLKIWKVIIGGNTRKQKLQSVPILEEWCLCQTLLSSKRNQMYYWFTIRMDHKPVFNPRLYIKML